VMGSPFFCQIAEAFFSGLTNGTSATTFSPSQNVTREQMAAFTTRTMDQSLKRGSRRAALKQFWTPTSEVGLGLTTVGTTPLLVESDLTPLGFVSTGTGPGSIPFGACSDGLIFWVTLTSGGIGRLARF